jgi:hypothetical protein
MDAGSMTLALQLSDSISGTLLAVAYDSKRDSSRGKMQWSRPCPIKPLPAACLRNGRNS